MDALAEWDGLVQSGAKNRCSGLRHAQEGSGLPIIFDINQSSFGRFS